MHSRRTEVHGIIHGPDYVLLVLFIGKTHNHFWVPSQHYKYVLYTNGDSVLCFYYLRVSIVNSTYHVPTYRRTYASSTRSQHCVSALCLSTMSQHSGTETKTTEDKVRPHNCRSGSQPETDMPIGLAGWGQGLTGLGQGLTGWGQGLTGLGQGLTGWGLTGLGQGLTGWGQGWCGRIKHRSGITAWLYVSCDILGH